MNPAQIHLALIHFPVAGTVLALALLVWALKKNTMETAQISLGFLVLVGLAGAVAYFTGEGAEEVIENIPNVDLWIHNHEEAAEVAFLFLEAAASTALVGLFLFRKWGAPRRGYTAVVLGLTLLASVLLGRAAHLGGAIQHPEIRGSAGAIPSVHNADEN